MRLPFETHIEKLGSIHDAELTIRPLTVLNAGVSVVLTTHSPFIVDHLNNLIAAAGVSPAAQDRLATHFMLRSRSAFIAPDKVAAYSFEPTSDGRVIVEDAIQPGTGLIGWETFARVSRNLSSLYEKILAESEDAVGR